LGSGYRRSTTEGPVAAGQVSAQPDQYQRVDAVQRRERRGGRSRENDLEKQEHEQDRGQDGRAPRVPGAEREPDQDEDVYPDEVAVQRVQPGEAVGVLERGVD